MRYWLKIQYPQLQDISRNPSDIWLEVGKEDAADCMGTGDLVLIYESKGGRSRADGKAYWPGRKGIVALVEVTDLNLKEGFGHETVEYIGRTNLPSEINTVSRRLVAYTRMIDSSGFCSNDDVCACFGYSRGFHFMGFGKSGLKEISKENFQFLMNHFQLDGSGEGIDSES